MSEITGEVYKEDLAYLIAQQKFKTEAQNKWNSSESAQGLRVRR